MVISCWIMSGCLQGEELKRSCTCMYLDEIILKSRGTRSKDPVEAGLGRAGQRQSANLFDS